MKLKASSIVAVTCAVYLSLFAVSLFLYLMIWFTDMQQPSLDIMEWGRMGRWCLFMIVGVMAPLSIGLITKAGMKEI